MYVLLGVFPEFLVDLYYEPLSMVHDRQSYRVLTSAINHGSITSSYKFVVSNINNHVMKILVLYIMPDSLTRLSNISSA